MTLSPLVSIAPIYPLAPVHRPSHRAFFSFPLATHFIFNPAVRAFFNHPFPFPPTFRPQTQFLQPTSPNYGQPAPIPCFVFWRIPIWEESRLTPIRALSVIALRTLNRGLPPALHSRHIRDKHSVAQLSRSQDTFGAKTFYTFVQLRRRVVATLGC